MLAVDAAAACRQGDSVNCFCCWHLSGGIRSAEIQCSEIIHIALVQSVCSSTRTRQEIILLALARARTNEHHLLSSMHCLWSICSHLFIVFDLYALIYSLSLVYQLSSIHCLWSICSRLFIVSGLCVLVY